MLPNHNPNPNSPFVSLNDCLGAGAVHVTWLKSGHEVLQERSTFLLGLIGHLAQMSSSDNCCDVPLVNLKGADISSFDLIHSILVTDKHKTVKYWLQCLVFDLFTQFFLSVYFSIQTRGLTMHLTE